MTDTVKKVAADVGGTKKDIATLMREECIPNRQAIDNIYLSQQDIKDTLIEHGTALKRLAEGQDKLPAKFCNEVGLTLGKKGSLHAHGKWAVIMCGMVAIAAILGWFWRDIEIKRMTKGKNINMVSMDACQK